MATVVQQPRAKRWSRNKKPWNKSNGSTTRRNRKDSGYFDDDVPLPTENDEALFLQWTTITTSFTSRCQSIIAQEAHRMNMVEILQKNKVIFFEKNLQFLFLPRSTRQDDWSC